MFLLQETYKVISAYRDAAEKHSVAAWLEFHSGERLFSLMSVVKFLII